MSRTPLPLHVDDISALARSLRGQLSLCEKTPGHVELLNMLARSTGFRNFQHFRAETQAHAELESPYPLPAQPDLTATEFAGQNLPTQNPTEAPAAPDLALVKRAARYFDAEGRLARWPGKYSHRIPCIWVLWSRIPANQDMTEKQVNEVLAANHLFEDHALLRRWLCDLRLVDRTPDGRRYRRIEQVPTPEALALFRLLNEKKAA